MIEKFQNIFGVTKTELIAVVLILLGLLTGATLKYFNYGGMGDEEKAFNLQISHALDSLAEIRQSSYIGTDNRNNSIKRLALGDTLVKQETLFPSKPALALNGMINLNTASKLELMNIPGVGEKTAISIIDYRTKSPFKSISEIMNIKGIGAKKFAKMKDVIEVK